MDSWQMAVFFVLAVIGVYKLVEGFKGMDSGLQAICLHLDAIKKNGAHSSERIVELLTEQNKLLERIAEQQQIR